MRGRINVLLSRFPYFCLFSFLFDLYLFLNPYIYPGDVVGHLLAPTCKFKFNSGTSLSWYFLYATCSKR